MDEWEEVVRSELRSYCRNQGTRTVSEMEVHDTVLPALQENFPNATAYVNHLNSAIRNLDEKGEIESLSGGEYKIKMDDPIEIDEESITNEKNPSAAGESDLQSKSLYELLRSCQMGEAGAIVGGHIDRNDLRQALYVQTREDERVTNFFSDEYTRDGKHLIITGSAGDGKSALLSRAFKTAQDSDQPVEEEHIHMDATASRGKHQTYDDTLSDFLEAVTTLLERGEGPRTGLAINLGLAIDFFERQGYRETFPAVWEAIDSARDKRIFQSERIIVINLSHRFTYSYEPNNIGSGLLRDLIEKFAFDDPDSPFFEAYNRTEDRCPAPDECPLHYNAALFTDPDIRENVAELIAASGLINNDYLNPRSILDIISKILVPDQLQTVSESETECPVGKAATYNTKFESEVLLWNSVFERLEVIGDGTHGYLDPVAQAEKQMDEEILSWSAGPGTLGEELKNVPQISDKPLRERVRTAVRKRYIKDNSSVETALDWSWFDEFTGALTFFDPPESSEAEDYKRETGEVVDTVTRALKGWTGQAHAHDDWVEFVDGVEGEYKFLSRWETPEPDIGASKQETQFETIPGQLWIVLQPGTQDLEIPVPVTFELYLLMKRISRGYRPNSRDLERSEGIRLINSRLSEFTDKDHTVRILDKSKEAALHLDRDALGNIQIETGGDA